MPRSPSTTSSTAERVGPRVEVTDLGRMGAAHDAERAVGHRGPRVDDREVRRGDVEHHHRGRAEVDPAVGVEGLVDRAGRALERRQRKVRELGRVGAQLRHHDAQIGVDPRRADRLLHEATLEAEGAQVVADVDDPVVGGLEAEVARHLGD